METTDTLNGGDWLWYIITMCYNIRCVHVAHWCRLCKWCLQWSLQYIVTHDSQKVSMFYSPIWTSISSKFSFKVSFKLITYDQYYKVVLRDSQLSQLSYFELSIWKLEILEPFLSITKRFIPLLLFSKVTKIFFSQINTKPLFVFTKVSLEFTKFFQLRKWSQTRIQAMRL